MSRTRDSPNPKRRIAPQGSYDRAILRNLYYIGSNLHKKHPADYDFTPPVAPRASKSVCDDKRIVKRAEATRLFRSGIARRMMSSYSIDEFPKYIWAVDRYGEVYEAKLGSEGYHGYRLGKDERAMCRRVLKEWKARCNTN